MAFDAFLDVSSDSGDCFVKQGRFVLSRYQKADEDARIQNKIVLGHWHLFSDRAVPGSRVLILTPSGPIPQALFPLFWAEGQAYPGRATGDLSMWQLKTADRGEPWTEVGRFDSVAGAARKIIELEEYPVTAVFFELVIETKAGIEEEAFAHLEHTGRKTERCYVVKRVRR